MDAELRFVRKIVLREQEQRFVIFLIVISRVFEEIAFQKILEHLDRRAEPATPAFRPFARAPPATELTGPEGIRLTVRSCGLRRDARLD